VTGKINLHELPSHTGGDLHGGISELMATRDRHLGPLVILQIWLDLFLDVSLTLLVIHDNIGGRGEVDALEQGCWCGGGGSIVSPGLHRWDAMALAPR
jgi:hypothetical protein